MPPVNFNLPSLKETHPIVKTRARFSQKVIKLLHRFYSHIKLLSNTHYAERLESARLNPFDKQLSKTIDNKFVPV